MNVLCVYREIFPFCFSLFLSLCVSLSQLGGSKDQLDKEKESDVSVSNGLEASRVWQVCVSTWLLYTCLHVHVQPTLYTLHSHSVVSSVDTPANFYIHVHAHTHVHAHVNTQVYIISVHIVCVAVHKLFLTEPVFTLCVKHVRTPAGCACLCSLVDKSIFLSRIVNVSPTVCCLAIFSATGEV